MTRRKQWMLSVLLGAVCIHVVLVLALPRIVMGVVLWQIEKRAGKNRFFHAPMATASARTIVRPSPDLAYSVLIFDVRERSLRVRIPVTEPYTSVSGFALNTDNFFALNDRQAVNGWIDVRLVGSRSNGEHSSERVRVVRVPSDRGLLLVRRVVANETVFSSIDQQRQQSEVVWQER